MKRILYILSALMILASCGKDKGGDNTGLDLEQKLYGDWHSTSLPINGEIYISFSEDKTFELYQKIGEGVHRLYRGTWALEESLLTGKYNDGEDWAASYNVTVADEVLTMTSNNDAAEKSVYEKTEIPATVKETCETVVKSK